MVAPSVALAGSAPSGYTTLAGDNIQDIRADSVEKNITAGDLEGNVLVSNHAETTELSIVTEAQADEVANGAAPADVAFEAVCSSPANGQSPAVDCEQDASLVISDDVHDAGRTVAIRTDTIRESLGYVPDFLTVRNNETGEKWQTPTDVKDGWLIADVEHFSSNAITWSGNVGITANPAESGSSFQYNLSSTDGASAPNVTFTGIENTQWDNESYYNLPDGASKTVSVGGNKNATSAELTITGNAESKSKSSSGSGDLSSTQTVSVSSNDGISSESVAISGKVVKAAENNPIDEIYESTKTCHYFDIDVSDDEIISRIDMSASVYNDDTDIRVSIQGYDEVEKTWTQGAYDEKTYDFNDVDVSGTSTESIEVCLYSDSDDARVSLDQDDEKFEAYSGFESSVDISVNGGSAKSVTVGDSTAIDLSNGDNTIDIGVNGALGRYKWTTSWTENYITEDPDVTVAGQTVSYTGKLSDGSTKSKSINLTPGDKSLDVVTNGGSSVNVDVDFKEHTVTEDAAIEINGHWLNDTGTLADGSTTTLNGDVAWLNEGDNAVNVSLADVTADAPQMAVEMEYTHDGDAEQVVDYTAEKWSERYNVSKVYTESYSSPNLTIPFASDKVVEIRDVEKQVNGGSWQSVSESDYSLDGTTLEVQLGSVSADDEVSIRANGSKVRTNNASITITQATGTANTLNTEIRIDSWNNDSYIAVPNGDGPPLIHYAEDESWSGADESMLVTANGEARLKFPNTGDGATATISTIPVEVETVNGDAAVSVESVVNGEPEFSVSPGSSEGDSVYFTYTEANDGETYELYSVTNEVVRDTGTAQSPLTLTDDDSNELLKFRIAEGGGGGGGGGIGLAGGSSSGGALPIPGTVPVLVLGVLGLAGFAIFARSTVGTDPGEQVRGRSGLLDRIAGVFAGITAALASAVYTVTGGVFRAADTRTGQIALVAGSVVALFAFDFIVLPEEARIIGLAALVLIGSWLGLRRIGQFSWPLYGLVAAGTLILSLNATGSDVFATIVNSSVFPIIAVAGIGVTYYLIRSWRRGNTTNIVIRGRTK